MQAIRALTVFQDTAFSWKELNRSSEFIAILARSTGQASVIESLPCGSGHNVDVREPVYLIYILSQLRHPVNG